MDNTKDRGWGGHRGSWRVEGWQKGRLLAEWGGEGRREKRGGEREEEGVKRTGKKREGKDGKET